MPRIRLRKLISIVSEQKIMSAFGEIKARVRSSVMQNIMNGERT